MVQQQGIVVAPSVVSSEAVQVLTEVGHRVVLNSWGRCCGGAVGRIAVVIAFQQLLTPSHGIKHHVAEMKNSLIAGRLCLTIWRCLEHATTIECRLVLASE